MKTLSDRYPNAMDSLTEGSRIRAALVSSFSSEPVNLQCYICEITFSLIARSLSNTPLFRCPKCSFIIPKGDSALDRLPNLLEEFSKDNRKEYSKIWFLSQEKFEWFCNSGHVWRSSLSQRYLGRLCTVCYGRKQVDFNNSFVRNFPKLLKEWSVNNVVNPSEFSYGSKVKVEWVCLKGHFWIASISSRTRPKSTGCPKCFQSFSRSKGEVEVFDFLKVNEVFGNHSDREIAKPYELDFVSKSLKKAVEYNGDYWHSDKMIFEMHGMSAFEFHSMKKQKAEESGYVLVFIWESDWLSDKEFAKDSLLKFFKEDITRSILDKLSNC